MASLLCWPMSWRILKTVITCAQWAGVLLSLSTLIGDVADLRMAQFSQHRESAADAIALDIVNCHYGHVGGATEFFDLIKQADENFDFAPMHYFSSHPEIQARIDSIQRLGQLLGYRSGEVVGLNDVMKR
ncbi:MAG: Zn-dependent protease with chaperone function [Phenylobacterium sp.]|jgi:Zn-dependent protease with chaperone function